VLSQYGLDRNFPEKQQPRRKEPMFGPWRNPNKPKCGIEKLIGGCKEAPYIENMDQDKVKFHDRSEKQPVWKPVTGTIQMRVTSVMDN
jgi:hypothetical protein